MFVNIGFLKSSQSFLDFVFDHIEQIIKLFYSYSKMSFIIFFIWYS